MSSPVVLVTGGFDHKLRFWEATSGVCTSTITFSETSQVNCVQISPDKTLLAAGGNPLINIYDISGSSANNDDKPILTYSGHSSNVMAVGFQKDLKWLYSCSDDGTIKVWDPRSNKTSRTYDCGCAVNTLVLHPNQSELISGDQNGYLRVWNLGSPPREPTYIHAYIHTRTRTHLFTRPQPSAPQRRTRAPRSTCPSPTCPFDPCRFPATLPSWPWARTAGRFSYTPPQVGP